MILLPKITDLFERSIRTLRKTQEEDYKRDEQCSVSNEIRSSNDEGWNVEPVARLINDSMSVPGRVYHSVGHVFDVASPCLQQTVQSYFDEEKDAVAILAALFHDVVYLSIDKKLSNAQMEILTDLVDQVEKENGVTVTFQQQSNDPVLKIVQRIFDYKVASVELLKDEESKVLPMGTNEYLSALIGGKALERLVSLQDHQKHIIQIVACIEASIPFRRNNPMTLLYERLKLANFDLEWNLSNDELIETVQRAAFFANCDARAFHESADFFINSTWSLLPEWKPNLLDPETLSLNELKIAIQLLEQRYRAMDPEYIYQSFENDPTSDVLEDWKQKASENLAAVRTYILIRLIAIQIVQEFFSELVRMAELSGDTDNYDRIFPRRGDDRRLYVSLEEANIPTEELLAINKNSVDADDETEIPDESTKVTECLCSPRTFPCHWDANLTKFSLLLYQVLPRQVIDLQSESETTKADSESEVKCKPRFLPLLPIPVINKLGNTIAEHVPEGCQQIILETTTLLIGHFSS